ncbi:hypothetical protein FBQ87_05745 [Sphingobacteriales bacterium CHB3]|nr:hypothetical protein [Sphingobacteriales bacterium CHB3]
MSWLGLKYTGSFQSRKFLLYSEDPLREVWASIALYGTKDFLRANFKPTDPEVTEWESILTYASVRIRQSVEFQRASNSASPLTSPLSLYYSLLNLLRACTALIFDKLPEAGHGLKFQRGEGLFDSRALLLNRGTFPNYLREMNIFIPVDTPISFGDAVSRIVELRNDYTAIAGRPDSSFVVPVKVDAEIGGALTLVFPPWMKDFRSTWLTDFPKLVECSELHTDGNILRVLKPQIESEADIERFCAEHLEPSLVYRDLNVWSLIRNTETIPLLSRPAYYFVSLFILASIVRYEPELLSDVVNPDAQISWFVQRLLANTERFFPQLMIWWLNNNQQIYF